MVRVRFSAAVCLFVAVFVVFSQSSPAQTFTVLHTFTGENDGGAPGGALLRDEAGNLYGETLWGGDFGPDCSLGCGTVFKLSPHTTGWVFSTLYKFQAGSDGAAPQGIARAQNGALFGVTAIGGTGSCDNNQGCGTVYELMPPPSICRSTLCPWTETVLYRFTGSYDGGQPGGNPIFDSSGNLYDTAGGGGYGYGVAFELTPSNGSWTESVLHAFAGGHDVTGPNSGVIFDHDGNLDGVATEGGAHYWGAVFQLTPSQSGWSESLIYQFDNYFSGANPGGALLLDNYGNLFGGNPYGANGDCGLVYELTPGMYWSFYVLYEFPGPEGDWGSNSALIMDAQGNLYGTTSRTGAYNEGAVFKLTPTGGGGWSYSSLHDFTGGSDGSEPSSLVMDANGNLFGVAFAGAGSGCVDGEGCGVVFEITP